MRSYLIKAPSFSTPAGIVGYATGALIANSGSAGSVVPLVFTLPAAGFLITSAKIAIGNTNVIVFPGTLNLMLYQYSPTSAVGDNAAYSTNISGFLGSVQVGISQAFSDGAVGIGPADAIQVLPFTDDSSLDKANQLYGLLQTGDANFNRSGSVSFTVYLQGVD